MKYNLESNWVLSDHTSSVIFGLLLETWWSLYDHLYFVNGPSYKLEMDIGFDH